VTVDGFTGELVAGRYRVVRRLGWGPRGSVFLCRDAFESRSVALKFPHPQLMASEAFREQFWLELVAAGRLRSPNVVPILTFGEDLELGAYYVAMPHITQPDLGAVLRQHGAPPPARSAEIIAQVLKALAVAHAADVVHANLKPSNVFVQLEGNAPPRATVGDFGFSHLPDPAGWIGTAEYGAPEQAAGLVLDPRSDIYSVGVMLYEMLAGRLPFAGPSALDVVRMHRGAPPPPPSGFRGMPAGLESVCLKALSKTPGARYQSAEEMLDALECVREPAARRARAKRKGDSLAPVEHAAPDPAERIPKRRAELWLLTAAALAFLGLIGHADLARFVERRLQASSSENRAALEPRPRRPDSAKPAPAAPKEIEPPPRITVSPEPAPAAPEEIGPPPLVTVSPEPAPAAPKEIEPPPLVAIQNDPSPQPSAAGGVALGAVLPRGVATERLRSTLDMPAIIDCYRASLDEASGQPFSARLDLETAVDGRVRWSRLRTAMLPPSARRCIERAALAARADVRGVNVAASVQLEFEPSSEQSAWTAQPRSVARRN
jgi:serine/threonine protein kinase